VRLAATASFFVSLVLSTACVGEEAAKPLITNPVYTKPQQLVVNRPGFRGGCWV
jgi:hypothetical protein